MDCPRTVVPTPHFPKRLHVLPLYPRLPARLPLKLRSGFLQRRASGEDHHDCLQDLEYQCVFSPSSSPIIHTHAYSQIILTHPALIPQLD